MGTGFVKEEIVATSNVFFMKELDPMEEAFMVGATISSVTEFQVPPIYYPQCFGYYYKGVSDKEERLCR